MAVKRKANESPVGGESAAKRVAKSQPPLEPPQILPCIKIPRTPAKLNTSKSRSRRSIATDNSTPPKVQPRKVEQADSGDELNLRSRTRSGKLRQRVQREPPVSEHIEDSEEDIPSPPSSPTKLVSTRRAGRKRVSEQIEDSEAELPTPPSSLPKPSPRKRAVQARKPKAPVSARVEDSEAEMLTPPPSPTKVRSPTKRQRVVAPTPKKRVAPSPVPDSGPESGESSPLVAPSGRRTSPSIHDVCPNESEAEQELSVEPPILRHNFVEERKREIIRAAQDPPGIFDEDDASVATNALALKQLSDLLEGTVARGEGNSCLLLGPRGSGKTRIVEQCISNLPTRSIVLRLCGWSQQTDRLALREIAYQLHQQTGSAFLLPDELDETDEEPNPFLDKPNPVASSTLAPSTNLHALISTLPGLDYPTVVILDAFDLFALHPRQSLLYCLLDTVQSCRATPGKGIVVIGMTTRIDTINLLEKRVKSRFSGRMLRTAAPSQVHDWLKLTRGILCSRGKKEGELKDAGDWGAKWGVAVQSFLDDETTKSILNETFSVTRDVRVLSRLLTSVALTLSPSSPFPTAAKLAAAAATQRARPRFSILHTLPYPSMCLLVACIHADTAGHPVFTFEMLREKVRQQIKVSNSAPIQVNGGSIGMLKCARPVLMSAFEGLVSARIIVAAAAPSTSIAKEFAKFRVVVGKEDVKRALTDVNLKKWLLKAT